MLVTRFAGAVIFIGFLPKLIFAQDRVPFTATVRETAYDRTGKVSTEDTTVRAVRRDGSTIRLRTIEGPDKKSVAEQRFIVDLTAAEEISIDGFTESVTTSPILRASVSGYQQPQHCAGSERTVILGYEVVSDVLQVARSKTRVIREERWLAPALGCFPLKTVLLVGSNESDLHVAKIDEVTSVVAGEPSSALFSRPAGFMERSPSQRRQEFNRRFPGVRCPNCDADADVAYYQRQGDRGR